MSLRIGVDIGGSFTDFAVLDDETRKIRTLKVFSRPDSPGSEVLAGIAGLVERYKIAPEDVSYFTHGTTVGVNAVVQRKGLRLALVTTEKFEDVLEIARLKIPDMYHLLSRRPEPLIPRDRVFGVAERIGADGQEELPVDEASVLKAIRAAQASGCEGVVISLLHAYRNPTHELEVKALFAMHAPALFVSCSHEVWPIIREYERTSTAIISGYVQPKVANYLTKLQGALAEAGVCAELKVTKSNGGVMSAENGKSNCVQMILSGTASGVIGATYVANQCGIKNCMSLDIGGTTADVALIVNGEPQYATGEYIGDFQIQIPSVSVSSIGDGGGSIAWVDDFGVLKVGPQSAGSSPGPACYGRGGDKPTITDAFAVMGFLGQSDLGYNSVSLDRDSARTAIGPLAERLGKTVEQAAEAIIRVSTSSMYAGTSRLISRFGIDPRTFTLLPFGGAGPMLACYLARALSMPSVTVPRTPGVLSALGGLIADIKNDFVKTTYYELDASVLPTLAYDVRMLEAQARDWMTEQVGNSMGAMLTMTADMRYRGQSFEIETPLDIGAVMKGDIDSISNAFHEEHRRLYGHSDEHAGIQLVALRLVIACATPKPELERIETSEVAPVPARMIRVWVDDAERDISLYRRADLLAGQSFEGPAVVSQDDATTCVLSGFSVTVDAFGNLVMSNRATQH